MCATDCLVCGIDCLICDTEQAISKTEQDNVAAKHRSDMAEMERQMHVLHLAGTEQLSEQRREADDTRLKLHLVRSNRAPQPTKFELSTPHTDSFPSWTYTPTQNFAPLNPKP